MSGRHLFSSKDIVDFKLEFMKNYQLKNLSKKRFFSMMMISALCTASPSSIFANVNEVQITMQAATLKGQVITESGEPVIGASVMLKGTSNGTITDLDGNFTLKGMSKGTLVISFIGYFLIAMPVCYICGFVLEWGITGIWIGYPIGLTLTGVMLCGRYYWKLKTKTQSKEFY